jgi:peroxiredoxin
VLLVFSDPGCEPCTQLAPKLAQASRRMAEPAVIMVSRGGVEINRRNIAECGVTFPVVLQSHWEISRQYAKFVTPIAFLINEEGFIAANVAVGAASILALLSTASSDDKSTARSTYAGEVGLGTEELPAAPAI